MKCKRNGPTMIPMMVQIDESVKYNLVLMGLVIKQIMVKKKPKIVSSFDGFEISNLI